MCSANALGFKRKIVLPGLNEFTWPLFISNDLLFAMIAVNYSPRRLFKPYLLLLETKLSHYFSEINMNRQT
jgi:hypothetical protein